MPRWLMALVVIYAAAFWIYTMYAIGITDVDDRITYLNAADNLASLHTDSIRTPVYPAFILMSTVLFGAHGGLVFLTALQWAVWCAAMRLLWSVCVMTGLRRAASVAVIAAMMAVYDVAMFNSVILPESFCVSSVIALMYLALKYVRRPSLTLAAALSLLTVLMIFLKPVFVILIPIIAVLFICRWRQSGRRPVWLGLGGMITAVILVFVYMGLMWRSYGFFAMTEANLWNDYHVLRRHQFITPDDVSPDMRTAFEKWYAKDPGHDTPDKAEYYNECGTFNTFQLTELTRRIKAEHSDELPGIVMRRFVYSLDYSLFWMRYMSYDWDRDEPYDGDMYFPFWLALIIFAGYMYIGVRRWIKTRTFPAEMYMPPAIWFAMYVTVMVGAMDDWGRLMAPSLSCLWLMTAFAIQYLCDRIAKIRKLS